MRDCDPKSNGDAGFATIISLKALMAKSIHSALRFRRENHAPQCRDTCTPEDSAANWLLGNEVSELGHLELVAAV